MAIAAAVRLFTASSVGAAPLRARQSTAETFSLVVNGTDATANFVNLGSFVVSYAEDAAWIGRIKQEVYAEPLLLSGTDGLTFQSYHIDPNGYQNLYIVPNATGPVGFSTPHSFPPASTQTTGFGFSAEGVLEINGENNFIACNSTDNPQIASYQVWWNGNGLLQGMECLTDIQLIQAAGCGSLFG
ncbi:hypothetical protein MMC08_006734 [Hypocenomyce scalaris]|nr:hypothetical protein [Hypocenomyce scalaris]